EEGPWFRTPKTGRITDTFLPGKLARFVKGVFGIRQKAVPPYAVAFSPATVMENQFSSLSLPHPTGSRLFLFVVLLVALLPILEWWLPVQDVLTHLLIRMGGASFLQQTTVPYELHFVSTLLTLLGFPIQTGREYITWQKALGGNEYIYFTWNCGGWQS